MVFEPVSLNNTKTTVLNTESILFCRDKKRERKKLSQKKDTLHFTFSC